MTVRTEEKRSLDPLSQGLFRDWTVEDSAELYGIDRWGNGYFVINEKGHVAVRPTQSPETSIDLKTLVDELDERGIQPPLLIRFADILRHRLGKLANAFSRAIADFDYKGSYRCVYPIKVNQQRQVVEEVLEFGKPYGVGLEAGSKPELLAVMAIVEDDQTPIICNGFKDAEFIEAVILATKIGKKIIPVVEKFSELKLIVQYARQHQVMPTIGVRVKLAARGAGKWEQSGGVRSKFGLTMSEALEAVGLLQREGLPDALKLLHFHMGSQINDIRQVKKALTEAARVYAELHRAGAYLEYIDVGGGLGVDYDGSKSLTDSSVNYTMQEYANDVVFFLRQVCDANGIAHPNIFSESGRAMVAYNSVLVFDVLGASCVGGGDIVVAEPAKLPKPVQNLWEAYNNVSPGSVLEDYHDAQVAWDQTLNLFNLGYCSLQDRALAERLFFGLCAKAWAIVRDMDDLPEDFAGLEETLADTYFCNLSIFQSLPDSWAINQIFPIMPIHRLEERPTRSAILADMTCDSDGKVDHFLGRGRVKPVLELHPFIPPPGTPGTPGPGSAGPSAGGPADTMANGAANGRGGGVAEPYYLAAFLVGAYQEILGDMHNLFGDTHAVHVYLDEQGRPLIDEVVEGDTVREMLEYVEFSTDELKRTMRKRVERALREEKLTLQESRQLLKFYEDGLEGYTYLE